MLLEKKYSLKVPEEKLWEHASDISYFSECIPGLENSEKIDSRRFRAKARPRFSFLSGSMELNFEILQMKRPAGRLRITGSLIGSTVDVLVTVTTRKKQGGTEVSLRVEAKLGGLLRPVPESMIRGSAEQIADDMVACISRKVMKE